MAQAVEDHLENFHIKLQLKVVTTIQFLESWAWIPPHKLLPLARLHWPLWASLSSPEVSGVNHRGYWGLNRPKQRAGLVVPVLGTGWHPGLLGPPQRCCQLPERPHGSGLGSEAGLVPRAGRGQGWGIEKRKTGSSRSEGSLCQILALK